MNNMASQINEHYMNNYHSPCGAYLSDLYLVRQLNPHAAISQVAKKKNTQIAELNPQLCFKYVTFLTCSANFRIHKVLLWVRTYMAIFYTFRLHCNYIPCGIVFGLEEVFF